MKMEILRKTLQCIIFIFICSMIACGNSGSDDIIYTADGKPEYNRYSVRLWLADFDPPDQYLESVAGRFDLVLTARGTLVSRLKNFNPDAKCAFYSNPVFTQPSCNYTETFYAHSADSANTHNRIKNSVHSTFLMNISSEGWISCYTDDLLSNIETWGYDCIFADDCGPYVTERIDFVPDSYSGVDDWVSGIRNVLDLTKQKIGDSTVLAFNGIYSDLEYNGRDLLQVVDGSLMEGFVFSLQLGDFLPEDTWKVLLNWIIEDTKDDIHFANTKFKRKEPEKNLEAGVDDRLFAFTSYLLVRNENLFYSMDDWSLVTGYDRTLTQYYPEMDVDLGTSVDNCLKVEDYYNDESGLYERKFEKGIVLVNPSDCSVSTDFSSEYYLVVPQGGGVVEEDGTCNGRVILKKVRTLNIPEQSGAVILYSESG